jgi:DNA invertase Pin-like site-specific DNA recombinase
MLGLKINCGIYCRTARADSGSINLQERILASEIERRGFTPAGCYVDDGCSGISDPLDRPGFNSMVCDLDILHATPAFERGAL